MMRILIVNHQFFPAFYTGTEQFSLNLGRQLQRMGHWVEMVTYGVNDSPKRFKQKKGPILIWKYVYKGLKVTALRHRKLPERLHFDIFDHDIETFFRHYLKKKKIDIVHVAHPMRIGSVIKAADALGIPTLLTLTDFWLLCPLATQLRKDFRLCTSSENGLACSTGCFGAGLKKVLQKRYQEATALLKRVDHVCAPSRFLIGMFQQSVPETPIACVRHGMDYTLPPPKKAVADSESDIIFGFIGTILKHKGVDVLVDAFLKVKASNVRLHIHGGCFHEKNYLVKLMEASRLDSRIKFLGEYDNQHIGEILSEMDCVVVPSIWWENSPLTILTSLAHRVPVITSDIGGMKEFVRTGVNGYTFKMGDADQLTTVIETIAADKDGLQALSERIALPPRIEDEAFQYESLYNRLIKKDTGSAVHCLPRKIDTGDKLPNFFVVGAAKSGTTSLYHYMVQHPEIYLSPIKEPHYFSMDIDPDLFSDAYRRMNCIDMAQYVSGPMEHVSASHVETWRHYQQLYKAVTTETAIGELSTSYLYSETAAREIAAKLPDAKIVMILRNPIERAFSHFLMAMRFEDTDDGQSDKEKISLIQTIAQDQAASVKGWGASNLFLELGFYHNQVRRYMDYFPRQNIKIYLFDDFRRNPEYLLMDLFVFLGVGNDRDLDFSTIYNKATFTRTMSDEERAYLLEIYREDMERLSKLINRDLSEWY